MPPSHIRGHFLFILRDNELDNMNPECPVPRPDSCDDCPDGYWTRHHVFGRPETDLEKKWQRIQPNRGIERIRWCGHKIINITIPGGHWDMPDPMVMRWEIEDYQAERGGDG